MKLAAQVVYGVFGALAIGLGLLVLLVPAYALDSKHDSPMAAHLLREQRGRKACSSA